MTLPDEKFETVISSLRLIQKKYNLDLITLSRDSKNPDIDSLGRGISASYLYMIVNYGLKPKHGRRIEMVLRNLLAKLKFKYPLDETKVTKMRKVTVKGENAS